MNQIKAASLPRLYLLSLRVPHLGLVMFIFLNKPNNQTIHLTYWLKKSTNLSTVPLCWPFAPLRVLTNLTYRLCISCYLTPTSLCCIDALCYIKHSHLKMSEFSIIGCNLVQGSLFLVLTNSSNFSTNQKKKHIKCIKLKIKLL